jgi:hypothetical protein
MDNQQTTTSITDPGIRISALIRFGLPDTVPHRFVRCMISSMASLTLHMGEQKVCQYFKINVIYRNHL